MDIKASFCLVLILFIVNNSSSSSIRSEPTEYTPDWTSIDNRPLPLWFDEAKIGIFLHWGIFSVPSYGSEWFWWYWQGTRSANYVDFMKKNYPPDFTYGDFARKLTAEFYDPDKWVEIFKASGAKYVVLTSKHHEGYTMWPSKYSFNWNVRDVGPQRDLLGDLANAIRNKSDIRFGIYHSWFEWFNPLYLADKANNYKTQDFVFSKTFPELKELVNTYNPEVIWSDGDWDAPDTYWNSTVFLAWLYNQSPVKDTVVVNDRWGHDTGCKHGGYFSCADRYNPGTLQKHKWENAMTIDKNSWGFRREAQLNDYLTTHELIVTLAQTVSCGGNLLINIGPTHDGRIVPVFEERLREFGQWLGVNGEAIYQSKPWKYQNDTLTSDIWYTQRNGYVYAIVLNWPSNSNLKLGAVNPGQVNSIQMLGLDGNLSFSPITSGGTTVSLPSVTPNSGLQWAWVLKITQKQQP